MGTQLSKNKGGYVYLSNPKEQLMKMLVEKTRTIGHRITFKEASADPEMVNPNNYAFYFGSFDEATKLAWKKAKSPQQKIDTSESGTPRIIPSGNKPVTKKEKSHDYFKRNFKAIKAPSALATVQEIHMAEEAKELESMINSTEVKKDDIITPVEVEKSSIDVQAEAEKSSIGAPVEAEKNNIDVPTGEVAESTSDSSQVKHVIEVHKVGGRPRKYSYEQIKNTLIAFYAENGRLPTEVDTLEHPTFPSWPTMQKYLGRKSKWMDLIPPALVEKMSQPDPKNDSNKESPDSSPENEPIISLQHSWENGFLLIELGVLIPGRDHPFKASFTV